MNYMSAPVFCSTGTSWSPPPSPLVDLVFFCVFTGLHCVHTKQINFLAYLKPWDHSKIVNLELLIWLVPLRPHESFKMLDS